MNAVAVPGEGSGLTPLAVGEIREYREPIIIVIGYIIRAIAGGCRCGCWVCCCWSTVFCIELPELRGGTWLCDGVEAMTRAQCQ